MNRLFCFSGNDNCKWWRLFFSRFLWQWSLKWKEWRIGLKHIRFKLSSLQIHITHFSCSCIIFSLIMCRGVSHLEAVSNIHSLQNQYKIKYVWLKASNFKQLLIYNIFHLFKFFIDLHWKLVNDLFVRNAKL